MPKNQASKSGESQDPENFDNQSLPLEQQPNLEEKNQTEAERQAQSTGEQQGHTQSSPRHPYLSPYVQWVPVQVMPSQPNQAFPIQNVMDPNQNGSGSPNFGENPYPRYGPGYFPFGGIAGGRLEPGDSLYTTAADGPELRLISQQLSGPENYSLWSRELRRALVTKDKEGFIDGTVPIPSDERLGRHWRKCNQLVRAWIRNCLAPKVAIGLPPTKDAKIFWDSIREMYGKLDRAKIFSLTQALTKLKQGNFLISTVYNNRRT